MIEPPFPPDEQSRIRSLHGLGVLHTPAEHRFDRITRLATRLLDVPVSVISLVDTDSQWFKSIQGLTATETPRAVSFCGHAILDEDTLVIPDTHLDPRFADNPLVTGEPHIRFYAGHPIRAADGSKLGTLCVIDHKPKQISFADLEILRDLAGWVETELRVAALSPTEKEMLATLDDLRRRALLDSLTRAWNREAILEVLRREMERSRREHVPMGVIMADLDHFKRINDTHGHLVGDAALVKVADALRSSVRPYDAIGRYGGEEFLVVLGNCDRSGAMRTAERVRERVSRCVVAAPGGPISPTLSQGVIVLEQGVDASATALLAAADRALYRAKDAGRNRIEIGEPDH